MYNRYQGQRFRTLAEFGKKNKQFFRTLPLRGHVGLLTDKMAMSLVPEDLPLEPEIAATKTSSDGNCLFNAV